MREYGRGWRGVGREELALGDMGRVGWEGMRNAWLQSLLCTSVEQGRETLVVTDSKSPKGAG